VQATQIMMQAVLEHPERAATVYGERRRTWREVGDRVPRLAGALQALGVQNGDRVAALGMNSDRFLELFFAIPWAGAAFAPLNIRWSVAENRFALEDAEPAVLFVDDAFLDDALQLRDEVESVTTLVYLGDGPTPEGMLGYEDLIAEHEPVPDADRRGDDLYVVLYTSGTTVQSKGVALTHRNVLYVSLCFLATLPANTDLTHLHVGGMFHLSGAGPLWYITLSGGTHVILPKFDPVSVMQNIEQHRATNIVLVPTMVNMLLNHPELAEHDLSSIRTCVYGGSPMPEPVLRGAMEALPTWGFHQIYGMTETTGYATALRASDHADAVAGHPDRLRSAGRPVAGMQVRIQGTDGGWAPTGEVGEILIRGDNVMTSYYRNPDATQKTLQDGWIHSGDAGFIDEDGFLFVADRMKDMIVTGGENVYSVDVERALHAHPAVREAAVIGVPSERWGESVHAVIVLHDGASASGDELIAHCRTLIGGYKVPRSVEFRDEPLPTTPVGKVRKNVLRDPYWVGQSTRI
jgi:long-chain acyl-CoA synthetase